VSAGVLTGCGGAKSGAGATTVRLGDTVADSNPEIAAEKFFGDRLASLTKKKYQVKVFPNGTLGDHNRMNEQVRTGTLQMTKTLFANLTAFDKRLGALSLPYLYTRQEDFLAALDGQLGKECGSILDKYDLVLLGYFGTGSRNVYNKKRPIRTPGDLKGLRIRVPQDPVAIDAFNALGAQATPLAATEVYSALQQGVIDAAENNPIYYVTSNQVEEAKFWSWTRHQFGVDALLASKKWFSGLPKADQDAIVTAGKQAVAHERELWNSQTDDFVKQVLAAVENWLVAALLVATVSTILAQIFFRYVLAQSLSWSTEVATDLLMYIAFVGFAIGIRDNAHVALHLFESRLGTRSRRVLRVFELLVLGAVLGAIGIGGAIYAYEQRDVVSPSGVPLWTVFLALPLGAVLGEVHVVVEVVALLRGADAPGLAPVVPDEPVEPGTPAPAIPGGAE
jgi:tripartite ATP-independent transporter DctP family solute receptor